VVAFAFDGERHPADEEQTMADLTDTFYTADGAVPGYGTQWLIGDEASPEVFQAVAGVVSFQAGASSTSAVDKTHLRSTGRHREIMAGIRSTAPFTGQLIWLPEDESQSYAGGGTGSFAAGGLAKIAETCEERNMVIRYNTADSPPLELAFRGYISEFTPSVGITIDDKLTATVSVQPVASYLADLPA
jgi:hypothetical protein